MTTSFSKHGVLQQQAPSLGLRSVFSSLPSLNDSSLVSGEGYVPNGRKRKDFLSPLTELAFKRSFFSEHRRETTCHDTSSLDGKDSEKAVSLPPPTSTRFFPPFYLSRDIPRGILYSIHSLFGYVLMLNVMYVFLGVCFASITWY